MSWRTRPAAQGAAAAWFVAGAVSAAGYAALGALGDPVRRIDIFCALFIALWAVLIGAQYITRRRAPPGPRSLAALLAIGLLFRLPLLPWKPTLSDDAHRYLWDARVLASGVNPYRYAPGAPELAALREGTDGSVARAENPTIYPPLALAAFAAFTRLGPGVTGLKAGFIAVDFATALALLLLLRRRGLRLDRVLLYAWNPLAVVEIAGSAHLEPLAALPLVAALLLAVDGGRASGALSKPRAGPPGKGRTASAAALGLSILSRWVPVFAAPALLGRRPRAWFVLAAVVALGIAPFARGGVDPTASLRVYFERWRHNGSLFELIAAVAHPELFARQAALALTVAGALIGALVARRDPARGVLVAGTAAIAFAPTYHPWYALWMAPVLAVAPWPAWFWLMATSALSYRVLPAFRAGGPWVLEPWIPWIEYAPFYALLLAGPVVRAARRAASAGTRGGQACRMESSPK